jgi:predicted dehydrogenase
VLKSPIRFALVGAGSIAQSYAAAFEQNDELRLVAVSDLRADVAEALSHRFGAKSYTDSARMVEDTDFDAVIVSSPPDTHPDITFLMTGRGKHVLVEKPFCLTSTDARRMSDAARKANVKLTMASKFRYVDDVIRARSIVVSGILGDLVLVENSFTSRVDMAGRWNADPARSGGGVLIDNGTHSLDILRYLVGPLAEFQVVEGKRVQGLAVEDTVRIFARSQSGVMGHIDLSWSIDKQMENYLCIYGSHGTVFVGWKESRYRQFSGRDWVKFGNGYNKIQAFRSQLVNFMRAIRGEEMLLITDQDAVASVEAVEASYAALRQSRWTSYGHPSSATNDAAGDGAKS